MAARSLWRARALSATVVLTIGIASGLSTSIFSALNTVMLRPLPYSEADRLVHVGARIRE